MWHTFFYWIDNYYEATKDMITLRQQSKPVVWKDLTAMVGSLRKFQASQSATRAYRPPSPEQTRDFLAEEQTEAR